MALYRHATKQKGDMLLVTDELVEERCHGCGGEAFPQVCFAEWSDGKYHHHGRVHDLIDGNWKLVELCNDCYPAYQERMAGLKRNREGARP